MIAQVITMETICQTLREFRNSYMRWSDLNERANELNIGRLNTSILPDGAVLALMINNICETVCDCDIEHLFNWITPQIRNLEHELTRQDAKPSICGILQEIQTKSGSEYIEAVDECIAECKIWMLNYSQIYTDKGVLERMMYQSCKTECNCSIIQLYNKAMPDEMTLDDMIATIDNMINEMKEEQAITDMLLSEPIRSELQLQLQSQFLAQIN